MQVFYLTLSRNVPVDCLSFQFMKSRNRFKRYVAFDVRYSLRFISSNILFFRNLINFKIVITAWYKDFIVYVA